MSYETKTESIQVQWENPKTDETLLFDVEITYQQGFDNDHDVLPSRETWDIYDWRVYHQGAEIDENDVPKECWEHIRESVYDA